MTHLVTIIGRRQRHQLLKRWQDQHQQKWAKWNKISKQALGQTEKDAGDASCAVTLSASQRSNPPHGENSSLNEGSGRK